MNLSFFAVGPPPPINAADVPLIERTTVELSGVAKTCPRNPSSSGSQPKGYPCNRWSVGPAKALKWRLAKQISSKRVLL